MHSDPQDEKTDAEWRVEMEALFDVPFVFWVCPAGCRGTVTWHDNCRYATCDECGQRSDSTAADAAKGDDDGDKNQEA